MGFVDTHVHLHFEDFESDRKEVIQRARDAGVELFLNVGTDVQSSKISKDLAENYDFIYAAAGIHPHDAKDATDEALKEIEKLLTHPRVVALGEVGLDFFRDHSSKEDQIKALKSFFKIYARVQKPLIIHCRDAYDAFIELLDENSEEPYRGVMHCFSSDKERMLKLTKRGFHISFAGPLTYKKNDELREACSACPEDKLLFETDAPFLPPQSYRGKRNETVYMLETAKMGAEVRGVSLEQLAEQTRKNAADLFGI